MLNKGQSNKQCIWHDQFYSSFHKIIKKFGTCKKNVRVFVLLPHKKLHILSPSLTYVNCKTLVNKYKL